MASFRLLGRQALLQGHRARATLFSVGCRRFLQTDIKSSELVIDPHCKNTTTPYLEDLQFGKSFTDNMLEIDWKASHGWGSPVIKPLENLSLHPASMVFHYALEAFEGMKAYLDDNRIIRLFRPEMNMERLNSSAKRLALPQFNGAELLECIKKLVLMDKAWIPNKYGYSLYIRPTLIGTTPQLGVGAARDAKLFVILSPVGVYYKEGFNPVKLYCDRKNVRAWPGGTGHIKCGGNYAMTVDAQLEAQRKGYSQVLWIYGDQHIVQEVGTMNQFFLWKTRDDELELVTCPLDGTILPGVTRDSVLSLCREWNNFRVTERHYSIEEVIAAVQEGRMVEAFGTGTAAVISPVSGFYYEGKEYPIGGNVLGPGELAQRLFGELLNIQYGRKPHHWSVPIGHL